MFSDKPNGNLISRMDQPKEVKWSLPIGRQYKIEEPTPLQSMKVRVENQLPSFNQFVEELLESESLWKPSTYQQQHLRQTSLLDLNEQRKKLFEEASRQEQRFLYPRIQDTRRIVMNTQRRHTNSPYHIAAAEHLISRKVLFKPSVPASKGMMSVIDPPQLAPNIPRGNWIPLVHI